MDKAPILLTGAPSDYIRISSGLGEAPPVAIVILPVVFEDQVLGVVELASFTPFSAVTLQFLEQLMEIIGVSLNAIIANSRTQELLVESQRLASELQSKSEELQTQQEELQQTNAELEEKASCWPRRTGPSRSRTSRSRTRGASRSGPSSSRCPRATSRSSSRTCRTSCARR